MLNIVHDFDIRDFDESIKNVMTILSLVCSR